jgi:GNAT superfamily N-acetyltransferase
VTSRLGTLQPPTALRPDHPIAAFSCGVPALDDWLKRRAAHNEAAGGSRTYVAASQALVAGYYSLAAGSVRKEIATGAVRRNMPEPIPIVVLGRLAVDRNRQGCGLGGFLLRDAVLRMLQAADTIGVRAMVVNAIGDAAKSFCERHGFRPSVIEPLTLMITVAEASRMLSSVP